MSWLWHWWLFFVAVIPCTIVVQFTRGAMNTMNVAKYGPRADYRAEPGSAIAGSVIARGNLWYRPLGTLRPEKYPETKNSHAGHAALLDPTRAGHVDGPVEWANEPRMQPSSRQRATAIGGQVEKPLPLRRTVWHHILSTGTNAAFFGSYL
jgi:hypothetical protein